MFHAKYKYPPSVRQICTALELSSPATVHVHINHLVDKGYIKRSKDGNRAIELLVPNEFDDKNRNIINVPLLGKYIETSPEDIFEMPSEYLTVPSYVTGRKKNVFAFKVIDDSMINRSIQMGDVVIAERIDYAKNGDIVIAMIDEHNITIKTYYKEDIVIN